MWVFFTGLAIFWNDINRKNWNSTKQATSFLVHGAGAIDVIYKNMHLALVGKVLSNYGISSEFLEGFHFHAYGQVGEIT